MVGSLNQATKEWRRLEVEAEKALQNNDSRAIADVYKAMIELNKHKCDSKGVFGKMHAALNKC